MDNIRDNLFRRFSHRPGSGSPQGSPQGHPQGHPQPPPLPSNRPTRHEAPAFGSQPASPWAPQNAHNRNQSVQSAQAAPPSVGWPSGPSFSGPTQAQGHSRPGNPHPRRDNDGFTGGFRPQGFNSPGADNQPIARTNSVSRAPQDSPTSASSDRDEALGWFYSIDQNGDGELSHEELHHALLTYRNTRFSARTVKYLVSVFDQNSDGSIGLEEFVPLWKYLQGWIRMFNAFDQDGNGRINTAELGRALARYSIHVAPDVLDMVMKKYGDAPAAAGRHRQPVDEPQMDLDHFVCACVSVREMCGLYNDCSAEGRPRIDRDTFLRAILALP